MGGAVIAVAAGDYYLLKSFFFFVLSLNYNKTKQKLAFHCGPESNAGQIDVL